MLEKNETRVSTEPTAAAPAPLDYAPPPPSKLKVRHIRDAFALGVIVSIGGQYVLNHTYTAELLLGIFEIAVVSMQVVERRSVRNIIVTPRRLWLALAAGATTNVASLYCIWMVERPLLNVLKPGVAMVVFVTIAILFSAIAAFLMTIGAAGRSIDDPPARRVV